MNSSRGGDSQKWSIFLMFSLLFYLRGLPFHIAYEDKWDRVIREKIESEWNENGADEIIFYITTNP